MSRPDFDEIYMDVVETISRRSTCLRKKVGAVVTIDNRILSHGYNGLPAGFPNCCDTGECMKTKHNDEDYKICVHAEQNAICQCAKRGLALEGATMYVNADICMTCAKLIVSCNFARVVVRRDFKNHGEGIELIKQSGIRVDFWDSEKKCLCLNQE